MDEGIKQRATANNSGQAVNYLRSGSRINWWALASVVISIAIVILVLTSHAAANHV